MEVAAWLDDPSLPDVDLPSGASGEAVAAAVHHRRAGSISRRQLIEVVDAHGAELEQRIASDALKAIADYRVTMARWNWLRSFPNPAHDVVITVDPDDLADLERELHARAHSPGPKPKRAAAKPAAAIAATA